MQRMGRGDGEEGSTLPMDCCFCRRHCPDGMCTSHLHACATTSCSRFSGRHVDNEAS